MKVVFVVFTGIFILAGCSDFSDSLAGNLGEKCFGNGTCRGDLICVDNVCVESIVDGNDEDAEKYDDQPRQDNETVDEATDENTDENVDNEIVDQIEEKGDDDLSDDLSDEVLTESEESDDETDENVFDEDADEIPDEVPDDAVNCSTAVFDSGAGTAGDPYVVSTPEDLNKIRCFPGSNYFRQMADIDLSEYKTGEGWVPIGSQTEKFAGTYYGNGFKITNLFINRPTENNQGLFGYVLNGSLNNIKIENVDVTGGTSIG
ncbi:MAG TPA: hypothetical protein PKV35_09030, partial [bacterium]|nr:hypothetical protein [bacterium]